MNGLIFVCLCLIAAVAAQEGDYTSRASRRRSSRRIDNIGGNIFPGGIIDAGIGGSGVMGSRLSRRRISSGIDRTIGGSIFPGDIIDRGIGSSGVIGRHSTGTACYQHEEPAYDRHGRIERCSYQYRYCYAHGATCRLRGRSYGTCCRPATTIGGQYCRDNSLGIGICYGQSYCNRLGRGYECQFNGGSSGTCCRRLGGIQY